MDDYFDATLRWLQDVNFMRATLAIDKKDLAGRKKEDYPNYVCNNIRHIVINRGLCKVDDNS